MASTVKTGSTVTTVTTVITASTVITALTTMAGMGATAATEITAATIRSNWIVDTSRACRPAPVMDNATRVTTHNDQNTLRTHHRRLSVKASFVATTRAIGNMRAAMETSAVA